jgi:hypothetical protein
MQISVAKTVAVLVAAVLFSSRSSGQIQNPITAARDAYNKARQQQQQQQQQQKQQQQQQKQQTRPDQAPQASATPRPVAAPDVAEPWTPPADTPSAPPVALDPSKMPDIVGVHLGMEPQEAMQILRKQYPPNFRFYVQPLDVAGLPAGQQARSDFLLSDPGTAEAPLAYLSFTMPPDKPVVWHVARYTRRMHINRDTLLAALRQKYGKETAALQTTGMASKPARNDSEIAELFWLYDERGGRVPWPPETAFPNARVIWECSDGRQIRQLNDAQPSTPMDEEQIRKHQFAGWCGSLVAVHVAIEPFPIVETAFTEMLDGPLALRTAHAFTVWQRGLAEKARKDDLEKSKQAKPVF